MTTVPEQPGDGEGYGEDAAARPGTDAPDAAGGATPAERIRSVLEAYHEAFDGDRPVDLTAYVHRPCTVVTRWGAYVLADRDEIESAFTSVQRDLRARGCERTERRDVRVRLLDHRLARARAVAVRLDEEARELERSATTYVLRRTGAGWRIAVLVHHEVEEDAVPD